MAYLYRKLRSPFWYIQYIDADKNKHDKSTGFRADDPNDTIKAKVLRAELEAREYQRVPMVNGAAWDYWVPKFFERHCPTKATLDRYEDAWKWVALWLQNNRIHSPRQLTYRLGIEYLEWRTTFKKRTGKIVGRNTAILELKLLSLVMGEAVRLGHADANPLVSMKIRRSRQRLLDLTLRNRLLNFRPGNPNYRDDLKGHKHVGLKGHIESLWQTLVNDEKQVEIAHLTRDQQSQLAQELRQSENQTTAGTGANLSLASLGHEEWTDVFDSIRGVSQFLQRGNLISLLPDENFRKRLTKIRNEQNTLANSTGDSALFLAIGFLEWCEAPPHPRANEPLFAPLILVHVNLDQKRTEEGGEREFVIHMDADQPQGNPCLAEKLR